MGAIFGRKKDNLGNHDYTPRQFAILNGDLPLAEVTLTEITIIMKKAKQRHDDFNYETAFSLYDEKSTPDQGLPKYSVAECRAILQSLTPWPIDWDLTDED